MRLYDVRPNCRLFWRCTILQYNIITLVRHKWQMFTHKQNIATKGKVLFRCLTSRLLCRPWASILVN